MRPDAFLIFFVSVGAFQPVKISMRRSDNGQQQTTTEDPDAYNSYDPFDLDDTSFFSDITNNSKRIKLQLETAQFIQKFGAQELLNIILRKVQNVNLPQGSKSAINDFLDFVEDLIYRKAADRIEKRLQMDTTASRTVHVGEVKKTDFGESKDVRRRDAPALAQNAVLIDASDNFPAVNQPLEPTKLMFFTHNELGETAVVKQADREVRRSPSSPSKSTKRRRRLLTKAHLEKAIKSAEREAQVVEMERILKRRREQMKARRAAMKRRRAAKKLPIVKLDDDSKEMRRSPARGAPSVSFNEKMFQLLDEFGIRSLRVETADYTVRAFADPTRTRFSAIKLLDVPEYNDSIRRKPVARPPFVYSRTIQAPHRNMVLRSRPEHKKRRSLSLERLL